jgi:hypothetical protein
MQFLITGVKGGSTRSGGTILCGTWFAVPQVASHVAILGSKFTTAPPASDHGLVARHGPHRLPARL